jgi:hypothetical protein
MTRYKQQHNEKRINSENQFCQRLSAQQTAAAYLWYPEDCDFLEDGKTSARATKMVKSVYLLLEVAPVLLVNENEI